MANGMSRVLIGAVVAALASSSAYGQTCASNFSSEGVPLLTSITFRSWQVFPKTGEKKALDNLARAVAAEGFSNIRVDRSLGAISATQEVTGSGRPQTLRVVARKSGTGTRVDAVFAIQQGQVAPESTTRAGMCRVVAAAGG